MKNKPFFSIIVVSYQAEANIKKTIESILNQSFDDFEIIVKDAQSTDNTLGMIPDNSHIKVYSTKDKGIYDGMNQAIEKANGAYVCFLNCGDCFYNSDVLKNIYEQCTDKAGKGNKIFYGNYVTKGLFVRQPENLSKEYLSRRPLCHQTVFFGKELLDVNKYDLTYKIMADFDLMLKLFVAGVEFKHIDLTICEYEGNGFSAQKENADKLKQEGLAIKKKYYTKNELFKMKIKSIVTMQKFRIMIQSDKTPAFIKKVYSCIANIVNR